MGCPLSTDTRVQPFDNTKENGAVRTPHTNGILSNSKQNGTLTNGKLPNTPRETLGQLPNQKETYVNRAAQDTRLEEGAEDEVTAKQSVPIQADTEQAELEKSAPEVEKPDEQTNEDTTKSSGEDTRSINNTLPSGEQTEPTIVPKEGMEGELKSHLTIKEVSIHNHSKGHVDIFPLRNTVYSTTKFKEEMKKVVEKKYEKMAEKGSTESYDYNDFNTIWKFNPIFLVLYRFRKMYLRFSDIKTVLPTCKVAEVSDKGELYEDIFADSKTLLSDLKGDSHKTAYLEEYMELLQRVLDYCESVLDKGQVSLTSSSPKVDGLDLNTLEFPLPDGVMAGSLQPWIVSWKPFETSVGPDGAWSELPDNVVNAVPQPLELEDVCRMSPDELPDLDFSIEGEAAWDVIEVDLVKNDISTDQQEKIWRSRDNRTDLNDPMFLLSRQTKIEMYFLNKYEWNSAKLEPYRGFVSKLQKAWKEFQALCDVDDYTVIPEDEY